MLTLIGIALLVVLVVWLLFPRPWGKVQFIVGSRVVEEISMNTSFNNIQEQDVAVQFLNGANQLAPIDGIPLWESSDEAVVSVHPSPDGRSAVVRSTGVVGFAEISVTADADLGAGFIPVTGVLMVTVTESGAVTVKFELGAIRNRT